MRNHRDEEVVRPDNGANFIGQSSPDMCSRRRIRRESATPCNPQYNGVTEHGLGIIQSTAQSPRIYGSFLSHDASVPKYRKLWAEAVACECDSMNRTATIANPNCLTPYGLWRGLLPSLQLTAFLKQCSTGRFNCSGELEPGDAPTFI